MWQGCGMWGQVLREDVGSDVGSGLAFCLPPPLWILVSALGISMPHIRAAFLSPLISLESRPIWGCGVRSCLLPSSPAVDFGQCPRDIHATYPCCFLKPAYFIRITPEMGR